MKSPTLSHDFLIGGALLLASGVFLAAYSATHYNMGSISRVGPGMFPTLTGVLLAVMGLFNLIRAFAGGTAGVLRFEWRPALFVLGGIAAFAAMVQPFGLVPAVLAQVALVAPAHDRSRAGSAAILAICLSAMAALIFHVGLAVPVRLFAWPL